MNLARRVARIRRAKVVPDVTHHGAPVEDASGDVGAEDDASGSAEGGRAESLVLTPVGAGLAGIPPEIEEPLPNELFAPSFYREMYGDVRKAPRRHFNEIGRAERRSPSRGASLLADAFVARAAVSATPMQDLLSLFPEAGRRLARKGQTWQRLRLLIHPRFYAAQGGADEPVRTLDEAFADFLARGIWEGRRPGILFHDQWYRHQLAERGIPIGPDEHSIIHFITVGWDEKISPTPLYDDEFYLSRDSRLGEIFPWGFLHYVRHGCYETHRMPSPVVPHHGLMRPEAAAEQDPVLLDRVLDLPGPDLRASSRFEEDAMVALERLRWVDSDRVREMVDKAAAIEPLIHFPRGGRPARVPPYAHPRMWTTGRAEGVRRLLPDRADTVVLVPHCRMAGSARVAGLLTRAVRAAEPDSTVIVLATDRSDFERPEWFDSKTIVFDLSSHIEPMADDDRLRTLLDVVRGLAPKRVINVNSRLGWDLVTAFGRQLSRETTLGAYLFTSDRDALGHKVGYPIKEFQDCFSYLDWVLIDNQSLVDELADRYRLPAQLRRKLVMAHTPAEPVERDLASTFERLRAEGRPLRAMWAGRFDRQKRFDVVVEIARQFPELEILAWGKEVLSGLDVDWDALPANIELQGTYSDFDELPLDEIGLMLYTAEWDGIPTILIDVAARGMAVVASDVGGVAEVIAGSSGYLVADALEPAAYVEAIKAMVADPAEVTRRAQALRDETRVVFSMERYIETIRDVLVRNQDEVAR